ncbi:MAG: hypothetical protein QNJ01_13140, partial [Desulfobacterales bacterium]|nr:hypothetical protein [Desulfobacterales bacterium]
PSVMGLQARRPLLTRGIDFLRGLRQHERHRQPPLRAISERHGTASYFQPDRDKGRWNSFYTTA